MAVHSILEAEKPRLHWRNLWCANGVTSPGGAMASRRRHAPHHPHPRPLPACAGRDASRACREQRRRLRRGRPFFHPARPLPEVDSGSPGNQPEATTEAAAAEGEKGPRPKAQRCHLSLTFCSSSFFFPLSLSLPQRGFRATGSPLEWVEEVARRGWGWGNKVNRTLSGSTREEGGLPAPS